MTRQTDRRQFGILPTTARWGMQLVHLRRREFIKLLGGAVAPGWQRPLWAQQAIPLVGFLNPGSAEPSSFVLVAFREGLGQAGFVEGQKVAVEYRWANGRYDQLQTLAAELVRLQVAVIAATGGSIAAQAAKAATATIPIIFNVGDDPIKSGLIASFNHPGGNITGVNTLSAALEPKRLGLLRELVPQAGIVAVLLNPTNPDAGLQRQDIQAAARAMGQELRILEVSSESDFDKAFAAMVQQEARALLVANDVFFTNQRKQIVGLAASYALPATYAFRSFAESGGLMSYSTNLVEVYRQVGFYVGRVLKGEKPAELPVVQPTKFEFVINLKTAKTLGLKISDNLLSLADEVIE
jgi:putative tryptophan/tyrosine transport system substrate-binding protein